METTETTENEPKTIEAKEPVRFNFDSHVDRIAEFVKSGSLGLDEQGFKDELKKQLTVLLDDFQRIHAQFLANQLKRIRTKAFGQAQIKAAIDKTLETQRLKA